MLPSLPEVPDDVSTLGAPERFLLWAMRAWVRACKTRTLPASEVEDAFAAIGLDEAAKALDAALRGIAQATRRPLLVHCPRCLALSEDERLLIDAAASVQNGEVDMALTLLGEIVSSCGAAAIVVPLGGLGRMLALAGIDLPIRPDPGFAQQGGSGLGPSLVTLH